jgi:asparagine N-glycosylation enzyme membrane subunit Stt3
LKTMLDQFTIFEWRKTRTIMEMQPLLRPMSDFTLSIALGNFKSGFFIGIIALVFITYHVARNGSADKNTLLIWSLIILLVTLGQRRFAYYLATNVALLTGYVLWQQFQPVGKNFTTNGCLKIVLPLFMIIYLISLSGFHLAIIGICVVLFTGYVLWQIRQLLRGSEITPVLRYVDLALAVVILIIVFYPNVQSAISTASRARYAPSDAWVSSLDWMRENTPEPFGDQSFYYQYYEPPLPEQDYRYPESAYGVMAWVDYGYWITRIAHRPVNLTPGPGGVEVAQFFLAQDEDSAQKIIQKLDSDYVIIDDMTAIAKFWALVQWAGEKNSQFYDVYLLPQPDNTFVPVMLYYPEYYRAMVIRLYNFNGQAVNPEITIVISYEEARTQDGQIVKLVTDVQSFPDYDEADVYISSQETGNYQVVGEDPFVSPVPLQELKHYRLGYYSDDLVAPTGGNKLPSVKIFKYIE